jgi:hypothetical protein
MDSRHRPKSIFRCKILDRFNLSVRSCWGGTLDDEMQVWPSSHLIEGYIFEMVMMYIPELQFNSGSARLRSMWAGTKDPLYIWWTSASCFIWWSPQTLHKLQTSSFLANYNWNLIACPSQTLSNIGSQDCKHILQFSTQHRARIEYHYNTAPGLSKDCVVLMTIEGIVASLHYEPWGISCTSEKI